jgi:ribonuclease PH
MYKRINRKNDEQRTVTVEKNIMPNSYGSVLISFGNTKVLCTSTFDQKTPLFIDENTSGWLTAEYNMLPGSTLTRKSRSIYKPDSRNIEIQRLIGRSLRASIDLKKIKGFSLFVDCDVIQADGGTRTASITGGYIALELAIKRMIKEGLLNENPLINKIAAISAGIIEGEVLLDIDYSEDSRVDIDFNVVMNDKNKFVEIQGTGEKNDFSRNELSTILELCEKGINNLFKVQEKAFKD